MEQLTEALGTFEAHLQAGRTRQANSALERFIRLLDKSAGGDEVYVSQLARDHLRAEARARLS